MSFQTPNTYRSGMQAQVKIAKATIHWDNLPTRLTIPGATEPAAADPSAVAIQAASRNKDTLTSDGLTGWSGAEASTINPKIEPCHDHIEQSVASVDPTPSSLKHTKEPSRLRGVDIPHHPSDLGTRGQKPSASSSTSPIVTLEEEEVVPHHLTPSFVNPHSEEEPAPIINRMWKRESRKFWNAEGETTWFSSTSGQKRRTLPVVASLLGLRTGDIFIHTVVVNEEKPYHQLWLRGDTSWQPIIEGHQIRDINGKMRVLVVNSDHEPSWVLKSTAQRNYNPNRKTRSRKK